PAARADSSTLNPRCGDAATLRREPVRLRGGVELTPGHAGLRPRHACLRIDVDPLQRREVEHDPAVADGMAVDTVTAALDGERQAGLAREEDAGDDVGRTRATHDQPRAAVDHRVEDGACLVITVVTSLEEV